MTIDATRRGFLVGAGAALSGLAIGLDPRGALAATSATGGNITPFLTITADGTVTAIVKHFEGGQGVATGLSALIAEEMNMALEDIRWAHAPSDPARYGNLFFGGFQGTGGSTAMANSFLQYRTAGAAAKQMLIAAAGEAWGVDAAVLALRDGVISGSGQEAGIGDFVEAAARMQVPAEPKLKEPAEFRVIGKEIRARRDTADKIDGRGIYAMDVQLDGQMVVALKRAPRLGAKVVSFDDTAAREVRGFIMRRRCPPAMPSSPMPKRHGPPFRHATPCRSNGICPRPKPEAPRRSAKNCWKWCGPGRSSPAARRISRRSRPRSTGRHR